MLKINKPYQNYYIQNGIIRTQFNDNHEAFQFLSHCKVSCDSPCCAKVCGEDNRCVFNTDTHGNVNSDGDSDKEYIDK